MPTVTERWWISLAHFPHLDMLLCIHLVLTAPFVLFVFWPEVETLILRSELSVLVPGVWRCWFPDNRQSGCMHVWLVEFVMLHVCLFVSGQVFSPGRFPLSIFIYVNSAVKCQSEQNHLSETIWNHHLKPLCRKKRSSIFNASYKELYVNWCLLRAINLWNWSTSTLNGNVQ